MMLDRQLLWHEKSMRQRHIELIHMTNTTRYQTEDM